MNLYGYAGGDPVNFSDPFGLCPDPKDPTCKLPDDKPLVEITTNRNVVKAAAAVAAVGVFGKVMARVIDFVAGEEPTTSLGTDPEISSTVERIRSNSPKYKQDGTTFANREGRLPKKDAGYYQEWTVETPGATNRGARRIVTGKDGEQYYTDDHYGTFTQLPKP